MRLSEVKRWVQEGKDDGGMRSKYIDIPIGGHEIEILKSDRDILEKQNSELLDIVENGYPYNAARFFGMVYCGVDSQNVANTAFAQYLEETYSPKERGKHNMMTDCTKFPAWLFAKIGGSK